MSDSVYPSAWRDILTRAGAVFENDRIQHFGNPAREREAAADGDVLVELSHLSVWRAQGEDAESFLQGQLSNDIRLVSDQRAQLSAYCNPKGRMLAIFLACRRGASYYLQLPASLAEPTFRRLRMFILRAKVQLDPADGELLRLGLSGPKTESLVTGLLGSFPADHYHVVQSGTVTAIRLPGPHPRVELLAPATDAPELWQTLARAAQPAGAGVWSWLDIMAGVPVVLPGTVEEFVPQMANLELVNGVSFSKGCYPGQEIVARMHYLGRLKQRMFCLHLDDADTLPQPGTSIFSPDLPGQGTGTVVDAAWSPRGGVDLLAVVHLSSAQHGELHLQDPSGARLVLQPLPYPLPDNMPSKI